MMFSTWTALQLLVTFGATLAASTYHNGVDMISARDLPNLDYPKARSIIPSHQEYSRDYEGDLVLSTRDLSLLGVRADDISHVLVLRGDAQDQAQWAAQLKVHETALEKAKKQVDELKEKVKNEKDKEKKKALNKDLESAKEAVRRENDEILHIKDLMAGRTH
jgi:hypothetical protein